MQLLLRQELVLGDVWECAAGDKKLLFEGLLSCLKQQEKKCLPAVRDPAGQTRGGFSTGMCSQRGALVERRDGDVTRIA